MSGAPQRGIWKELNFQVQKDGKKYTALCLLCKQTVSNISTQRLKSHRNRCNCNVDETETILLEVGELDNSHVMDLDSSMFSLMDISNNEIITSNEELCLSSSSSAFQSTPQTTLSVNSTTPSSDSSSTTPSRNFKAPSKVTSKKKQGGIVNFFDKLSSKEEDEINSAVAKFFYGCNIPLNVIDAKPFRDLMKKLRPSYEPKMPGRKALSTTLLDKEYAKTIQSAKEAIDRDSVLLIDGWKNTASNTKTVVTMLHNVDGIKFFLEAFDVSCEQETADKLCEIVEKSIEIAKELYDTNVFAVVSDNAANMLKMGRDISIWHSNCSAHVANLLAKSIVDKEIAGKATKILKEFRQSDFEKRILFKGGTKIKIPAETRWCSYRDSFACLTKNLPIMRTIVAETDKQIKQEIKRLLFDDIFEEDVKHMISLLDPVCVLLNKVQATSTSIADAAHLWLYLELPQNQVLNDIFQKRISQALNVYALSAFYLHPYYDRNLMTAKNLEEVTDFLLNYLDGEALVELDLFLNCKSYFGVLLSKKLNNDANLFWRMASLKYPNLAKTAAKLLSIPASSAQIERLFSNWSYIHSDIRNRLTFERSKKLVAIYYKMKINEELDEDSDNEIFI